MDLTQLTHTPARLSQNEMAASDFIYCITNFNITKINMIKCAKSIDIHTVKLKG